MIEYSQKSKYELAKSVATSIFSQGNKVSYILQFEEYKLGLPAKYVTTAVLVDIILIIM